MVCAESCACCVYSGDGCDDRQVSPYSYPQTQGSHPNQQILVNRQEQEVLPKKPSYFQDLLLLLLLLLQAPVLLLLLPLV